MSDTYKNIIKLVGNFIQIVDPLNIKGSEKKAKVIEFVKNIIIANKDAMSEEDFIKANNFVDDVLPDTIDIVVGTSKNLFNINKNLVNKAIKSKCWGII